MRVPGRGQRHGGRNGGVPARRPGSARQRRRLLPIGPMAGRGPRRTGRRGGHGHRERGRPPAPAEHVLPVHIVLRGQRARGERVLVHAVSPRKLFSSREGWEGHGHPRPHGSPRPAPPAAPAPPPPGPSPPAGMPPPRAPPPGDRLPVALLAVVAVVVAIVVIAAVWWIFVASVFVPPAVRPQVSFSTPSLTQSGAATFSVIGASAAYPGVAYRANLEVDTVLGTADWLRASTTITVGSTDYTVNWQEGAGPAIYGAGCRDS